MSQQNPMVIAETKEVEVEQPKEELESKLVKRKSASQLAVTWRRFKRNKAALAGSAILLFYAAISIIAFLNLAPYPRRSLYCLFNNCFGQPPSLAHPFGTEQAGYDVFSEVIYGTPNDLYVGIVATLISVAIGIVIGTLAGYFRSGFSVLLLGITQVFLVLPVLVIILLFARIFDVLVAHGLGLTLIVIILGVFGWPGIAYIVRGEIFRIREMEYIQAENALGARSFRIMFRHVFPNVLSPVIVYSSLAVAGNILTEVVISFLGFGDPNTVTWGLLLQEGFGTLYPINPQWWTDVFSGLFVVFCVLGFNLLGDGLQDALNPRLRET